MNCDMAFECLTDPQQRDCDELQQHLKACPRCCQMKETLDPAFNLFDAAVGNIDDNASDASIMAGDWLIPGTPGQPRLLPPESVRLAEFAADELATCRPSQESLRRTALATALRYAAVFLAGVACTLGVAVICSDKSTDQARAIPSFSLKFCTFQNAKHELSSQLNAHAAVVTCVACHFESDTAKNSHESESNAASVDVVRACITCHLSELDATRRATATQTEPRLQPDNTGVPQQLGIETSNVVACLWPGLRG